MKAAITDVEMTTICGNVGREYADAMIRALVKADVEVSRKLDGVVAPEGK